MMALKKKYSIKKKKNNPQWKEFYLEGAKALSDSELLIGKRYN